MIDYYNTKKQKCLYFLNIFYWGRLRAEKIKKSVILSKVTRENIFAKSRFKEYKTNIQFDSTTMSGVKSSNMNFIVD